MCQGPPSGRHGHALVMVMNTTDELRQMGLDVAQRKHGHSQKYDQKFRQCQRGLPCAKSVSTRKQEAGSLFENRPLALVAAEGFEPSTSGL